MSQEWTGESSADAVWNDSLIPEVHECCGKAEHLLYTANGPILLSSHGTSPNTTNKSILVLLHRLPQEKRNAIRLRMRSLRLVELQTLAQVLRSFSDIQFDLFIEVLDQAAIPRILKYIEICVIPPTAAAGGVAEEVLEEAAEEAAEEVEDEVAGEVVGTMADDMIEQVADEMTHEAVDVHMEQTRTLRASNDTARQPNEAIVRHMRAAPLEVTHIITDQFLRNLFVPGYLFPDQIPLSNGCFEFDGRLFPDTDPGSLIGLNRYLLPTYERLLWEENVWVIGPGHQKDALHFLDRIPDTWMRIKRMYLTLKTEDICGASELIPTMIESVTDVNGNIKLNTIELLERFTSHCDEIRRELIDMWWSKMAAMTFLVLNDLTLDVRQAYGPDGVFLPSADWFQTFAPFDHGLPAKFKILAPNAELETAIRQAFNTVNAPRP